MEDRKRGVLLIVPTFSPNTGGVETHMDDLVKILNKSGYRVFVQTYSPITTPFVKWKPRERYDDVVIRRYRWFGRSLLHRIEKKPFLDFLYITPYLFLRVFIFFIAYRKKIDCIHAQGLNAAFIGKYLKKIFRKRLVVSIHAIYEIEPDSRTARFIKEVLSCADSVLTLSQASYNELVSFGLDKSRLNIYKYWIDLNIFRPLEAKKDLRKQLNLPDNFSVLFIGRLTLIKGIKELVAAAKSLNFINFIFIGNGPLEDYLKEASRDNNIIFLGRIDNKELYKYYNIADILCAPSQYEEGFGRVVMEAVACGVPVVGSNKGGVPEALDDSVSILVEPAVDNLKKAILELYKDKELYAKLKANCRNYAKRHFSEGNALPIINSYEMHN